MPPPRLVPLLPDQAPKYPLTLWVRLHKHVVEPLATEPDIMVHLHRVPEPTDGSQMLHHIVPRDDPVVKVHPQELRVLDQPRDLELHFVPQEINLPLHVLEGVHHRPRLGGEHPQGLSSGQPARVQELHAAPGGHGGAERTAGEDLFLDRLPAPELAQELQEAGQLAGVHGEEAVGVGSQDGLDFGPRDAEAGEFLKESAQAVVAVGRREAADQGGGFRRGEASSPLEECLQVAAGGGGGARVF
jgi:hypothetical protein